MAVPIAPAVAPRLANTHTSKQPFPIFILRIVSDLSLQRRHRNRPHLPLLPRTSSKILRSKGRPRNNLLPNPQQPRRIRRLRLHPSPLRRPSEDRRHKCKGGLC